MIRHDSSRAPYGYHDRSFIAQELAVVGFTKPPRIDTLSARSRASSARESAIGYC